MRRLNDLLIVALITAALACASGCTTGSAKPKNAAQYFREHQADTMTPHGKIMTDSVDEKEGKIQYKTEDGKQWRVSYSKRADGTYEYGMPDELK